MIQGPIYLILFGLIFFGIGAGLTLQSPLFRQSALPVQGEVTGNVIGNCDDDCCTYKAVVSYLKQDGKSKSYTTKFSSSPPAYDVGEIVTIYSSANNPNEAVIKGEGIIFRIIFMGVGGVVMLFGLVFFSFNLRNSFLAEKI